MMMMLRMKMKIMIMMMMMMNDDNSLSLPHHYCPLARHLIYIATLNPGEVYKYL